MEVDPASIRVKHFMIRENYYVVLLTLSYIRGVRLRA